MILIILAIKIKIRLQGHARLISLREIKALALLKTGRVRIPLDNVIADQHR